MIIEKVETKALLSTLWIFFLFNMIFRDIHELGRPGFLEEIMTANVSEGLFLGAAIVLEIAIAMVLLSRILAFRVNRWANIIAAISMIVLVLVNNTTPDLDDLFFAMIEVLALSLVIWTAWKWRTPQFSPANE